MSLQEVFDINSFTNRRTVNPDKLKLTFDMARDALKSNGIKFAVIGGLAMEKYMEPRNTSDVDIVVAAKDVKRAHDILINLDFKPLTNPELLQGFEDVFSITYDSPYGIHLDIMSSSNKFINKVVKEAVYNVEDDVKVARPEAMVVFKAVSYPVRLVSPNVWARFKGEKDHMDYNHILRTGQYSKQLLFKYAELSKLPRVTDMIRRDIEKAESGDL